MAKVPTYRHEVKYYECDGMAPMIGGYGFMEEARVYWMDVLGYGYDRMEADGVVSPVVSVSCNFKHPTSFKDIIEIDVEVAEMTELKLSFAYTMKVNGKLVCTATSTHCFLEGGRPVVLSQRFPQFYQAIMSVKG